MDYSFVIDAYQIAGQSVIFAETAVVVMAALVSLIIVAAVAGVRGRLVRPVLDVDGEIAEAEIAVRDMVEKVERLRRRLDSPPLAQSGPAVCEIYGVRFVTDELGAVIEAFQPCPACAGSGWDGDVLCAVCDRDGAIPVALLAIGL